MLQVLKELKVLQELKEHKVLQEPKEHKVLMAHLVLQELQEFQE